ncbi:hypothetical protein EJ04DRAFT_541437 [Polyplosphaeria fusca]|uniref:HRDC domain-containing protein n=1 Tax=Polyplosphaeria fusca TaxID=682080 RepID=A0A9P4V392_9PLEO|nr:hypothetical protein EJ04DRAFT_541437 [Polyplosphaeria fusca]
MDSFKALQDSISAALVSTTRSATQLRGADIPFQRSLNPALGTALDSQNARLLELAQRLLGNAATSSDVVGPKLSDVEAIDGNWKGIVDIVDSLLEKADISLDEYTGVVKRLSPPGDQAASASKSRPAFPKNVHYPKPQLSFDNVPRNTETGAFRPLITSKPHAKVSMDQCLRLFKDKTGRDQYPHPYETEIQSYEYPPSVYQESEPQPYHSFDATTATYVDTPEALATMLAELKTAKEIAIDLEHHDNRTYIGLLSLMQISTRDKDWIVDTLQPWRRRLECLNEVFADPSIIKVLHGAYMDIVWLQRDLGLYVVGLFDTFHAARSLGYPGAGLAYLLNRFTGFQAQKQYQLADWRVRPLSNELFKYAQADTHFLLYVYDNMRNELVRKSDFDDPEKNKVHDVLVKSQETALQRYENPVYDMENGLGPIGWYRPLSKTPVQYTPQQFSVFREIHKWRDDVARVEDESTNFVMPNHTVFSIARTMPKDGAELTSVLPPNNHIPRTRVEELLAVIRKAKDADEQPDLIETLKRISEMEYAARIASRSANVAVQSAAPKPAPALQRPPPVAVLETPDLRALSSSFWGKLLSKGMAEQRRPMSTVSINLALPLPPLTAEIFSEANGAEVEESPSVGKTEHTFVPKDQRPAEDTRSDIFIVKQLGGHKRKRTEVDEAPHPFQTDELMLEDTDADNVQGQDEKAREKARKKAAKKAAKKQKSRDLPPTNEEALDDGEEEPAFDYANAPSVLRAQEVEAQRAKGKKKKDKKDRKKKDQAFNPYAALQDAPKGLPRSQKEGPGKSKTFLS